MRPESQSHSCSHSPRLRENRAGDFVSVVQCGGLRPIAPLQRLDYEESITVEYLDASRQLECVELQGGCLPQPIQRREQITIPVHRRSGLCTINLLQYHQANAHCLRDDWGANDSRLAASCPAI